MTSPENNLPESPSKAPPEPVHCRICHRDTNDYEKHFKLHHAAEGGFSNACEDWNCEKYRREHSPNTKP
jgi:hypothetical protein